MVFSKLYNFFPIPFSVCLFRILSFPLPTDNSTRFFEYVGVDFRLIYASGQIIRYHGFGDVYNFDVQRKYQIILYNDFSHFNEGQSMPFWPHPIPYLPFFLVFLVPLSYIHPLQSFFVWTIFNLIFSMGYLIIWLKRIRCKVKDRTGLTILILILLSIQSFLNLTFGQVNIILLIAIGETLFNLTQGKYTTAGFWIGFGWIKPQAILLIIIVFLLRRNWHFITGFTYSSIIISITSMLLAGWKGIEGVITTLKNWPSLYRSSGMTWLSAVDHLVFQGVPLTIAYGLGLTLVIII